MKRRIAFLLAALILIGCAAACKKADDKGGSAATGSPVATGTGGTAATATPGTPTESATQAPTEEPKPTAEPLPTVDPSLVDAVIVNFGGVEDISCVEGSNAVRVDIGDGEPYLTVTTTDGSGDVHFIIRFTFSSYGDSVNPEDYPVLAFYYKVGYGNKIGATNHIYALCGGAGATPTSGMWVHNEFQVGGKWHIQKMKFADAFPAADSNFDGIRFPGCDNNDSKLYVAWMGAFRSEEDADKFAQAFEDLYPEQLVNDKIPTEKVEAFPQGVLDSFTESTLDFSDFEFNVGSPMNEACFDEQQTDSYLTKWIPSYGMRQSVFDGLDNPRLKLLWDAIAYKERLANGKAYSLSFDIMNPGSATHFGGVVFNYSANNCHSYKFYENNGLYDDGENRTLTNESGAGINFKGPHTIMVFVMTLDDTTGALGVISYDFTIEEDMSTEMVNVTVSDDGKGTVKIYVAGKHLASITYAKDGLAPFLPDPDPRHEGEDLLVAYSERFYREVKILGADGSEKASTTMGLMGYTKSFGFGSRAHEIFLDNIVISNKEK